MDSGGFYHAPTMVPEVPNQVTLTVWKHKRLHIAISFFACLIFATLTGTSVWLAIFPLYLPNYTYIGTPLISQKTYQELLSVGGNLFGALCGLSIAHGARAWATRELRRGTLTFGRYSALVAYGNAKVLTQLSFSGMAIVSAIIWLAVNQASTAVTGVYAPAATTQNYTYMLTQIDLEPAGGVDFYELIDAKDSHLVTLLILHPLIVVGFGVSDYEGGLVNLAGAIGVVADPLDGVVGNVGGTKMPFGFGISAFPGDFAVGYILDDTYTTRDKSFKKNLIAAYGTISLEYLSPFLYPSTLCVEGKGTATRTSTAGVSVNDWELKGACQNTSVIPVEKGREIWTVSSCVTDNPPSIETEYWYINDALDQFYNIGACQTTLGHGSIPVVYQQSPPTALVGKPVMDPNPASFDTHQLIWVQMIGQQGSQSLHALYALLNNTDASSANWTSFYEVATNTIHGISATKLLETATYYYGGNAYKSGLGTALVTPLTFTVPVIKIGAQREKALVILIDIVCLALCVLSTYMQLRQPHTSFDPLDLPAVLAVAQNSPPSPEMNGARSRTRMASYGYYQPTAMVPEVPNQVTLTVWKHSRLHISISLFACVVFATLTGTSIWLAMFPIYLPNYTYIGTPLISQKTYQELLAIGGNLAGALCALSIAHGVRAWATRELRRGTLTFGRYSAIVAYGNAKVLTKLSFSRFVVASVVIWLAVNQASTAVTGVYAPATTTQNYTYSLTQIDLEPAGGIDFYDLIDSVSFCVLGFGVADYEGGLVSLAGVIGYVANPLDGVTGSVAGTIMPFGFGISVFPGYYIVDEVLDGSFPTRDKSFLKNLYAAYGMVSLEYPSCVLDNPPAIETNYWYINDARGSFYHIAACQTSLGHGHISITYQQSPAKVFVGYPTMDAQPASLATHELIWDASNANWVRMLGQEGSQALRALYAFLNGTDANEGNWTSFYVVATNTIHGITAWKLYDAANYYYGGNAYESGVGTALVTPLTFTVPVIKIGAQREKALVILIDIVCLALCVLSTYMQLRQPHTSFDPLDLPAVLAVAQNSPPSPEVNGACAGKVKNIGNPNARLSYGVLHQGHLGFAWSSELDDPEEGKMYA
ncbi:hypothetical protein MNV49_000353 [Pseudohyphozyma bogoriensis]|nr:hypothetical protein MNV49_000353 [Pseudohyphozyma bogoriensis]